MFECINLKRQRTTVFRASGVISEEDALEILRRGIELTDWYEGRAHLTYADMRGLKTNSPVVARRIGELIAYSRRHGVKYCVHLSDQTVTRLQMARLGRQADPTDEATIEVVSPEEAERVLEELRARLRLVA